MVTDDLVERDTVTGFGGLTQSCRGFIAEVDATIGDFNRDLARINRRERDRFRQP